MCLKQVTLSTPIHVLCESLKLTDEVDTFAGVGIASEKEHNSEINST